MRFSKRIVYSIIPTYIKSMIIIILYYNIRITHATHKC